MFPVWHKTESLTNVGLVAYGVGDVVTDAQVPFDFVEIQ